MLSLAATSRAGPVVGEAVNYVRHTLDHHHLTKSKWNPRLLNKFVTQTLKK